TKEKSHSPKYQKKNNKTKIVKFSTGAYAICPTTLGNKREANIKHYFSKNPISTQAIYTTK
ncbi:hypothetical protein, partial [Avibacterium paragallinarum]|uniref:hypothetical protein n=1 Tax=Avibacterium paragallinarum TaxID=728 RepID=UPI001CFA26B9